MTLGELIDRVQLLVGCSPQDAFRVASELHVDGRTDYSDDVIKYAAVKLSVGAAEQDEDAPAPTPLPEISMNPAEVLREVYLACPRCVPADDDGKVHLPKIGRAPVEEQHEIDPEFLEGIPEHVRVLLLDLNVFNAEANVVFYDEANGVDRRMPPIDLTRFESMDELGDALDVLLKRLPRVIAADWN